MNRLNYKNGKHIADSQPKKRPAIKNKKKTLHHPKLFNGFVNNECVSFLSRKEGKFVALFLLCATLILFAGSAFAYGGFTNENNFASISKSDNLVGEANSRDESLLSYDTISNPLKSLSGNNSDLIGSDNLVCHYDFVMQNEGSTIIPDVSGRVHAGEIKGYKAEQVHSIVNTNIFGKQKKACKVYGGATGSYLEIPKSTFSDMVDTNEITISAWVNVDENVPYQRIFDIGTGTSNYFYILDNGQNAGFEGLSSAISLSGSGERGVSTGTSLKVGAWTLVTATIDNEGKLSLYENNKLVNTSSTHGADTVKNLAQAIVSQQGEDSHCYVGRSNYDYDPTLNGAFTDIKVFNKALTASEVSELYDVTPQALVEADAQLLSLGELTNLRDDFYVPAIGTYGSNIVYSSNSDTITFDSEPKEIDGKLCYVAHVNRPSYGQPIADVVITATLSYQGSGATGLTNKEFAASVVAMEEDEQVVLNDLNEALPKNQGILDDGYVLPSKGKNGSTFKWSSTDPNITVNYEDGNWVVSVTRPEFGQPDSTGKLNVDATYRTKTRTGFVNVAVKAIDGKSLVKSADVVSVSCNVGDCPLLPNEVGVTFQDDSRGNVKVKWDVESSLKPISSPGISTVNGQLIGVNGITEISATVNTSSVNESNAKSAETFNLEDVDLTGDSFLTTNCEHDIDCLVLMGQTVNDDTKGRKVMRMLYNFYITYGIYTAQDLDTLGIEPLGGWEEPSGLLRGHSVGHYISALSLAYSSSDYKKDEIDTILSNIISELSYMQSLSSAKSHKTAADFKPSNYDDNDHYGKNPGFSTILSEALKVANWNTNPDDWGEGFISSYSPDQFVLLEMGAPYGQPDSGIWAPYYTYHKLLAGFLEAYGALPDGDTKSQAWQLANNAGKWASTRINKVMDDPQGGQAQLTKMWNTYIAGEYGGMNESLAKLSELSNVEADKTLFKNGSQCFDNTSLFDKLSNNIDGIRNLHANQHIPQILGAIEEFGAGFNKSQSDEERNYYYDIASNFWQYVTGRYAYSIGGVGKDEKFTEPYALAASLFKDRNCESCCVYNMLKLTTELNKYNPENAEYMEYYEKALYNQIFSSQSPTVTEDMHNGTTYMLPIAPGQHRQYGSDFDDFSCCHGTGLENHVKYQESTYFASEDNSALYVGLYLPTTLNWESKGLVVEQSTNFPSEESTISVSGESAETFNLKLRVPQWSNQFSVTKNGVPVTINAISGTYVTVPGVKSSDVIKVKIPWEFYVDYTHDKIDDSNVGSIMYGPFVMCAKNNSQEFMQLELLEGLNGSLVVTGKDSRGLPVVSASGITLYAMPSTEIANADYHAYYKIFTDDFSSWFKANGYGIETIDPIKPVDPDNPNTYTTDGHSTATTRDGYILALLIVLFIGGTFASVNGVRKTIFALKRKH